MFSIITPVHRQSQPFLNEAYKSLQSQTVEDWEWVIIANGGAHVPKSISKDNRIKVFFVKDDDPEHKHNKIGRLKKYACSKADGNILVELDADDILLPTALEEIQSAFKETKIAMVYSNSAEFHDKTWKSNSYSEYWGWQTRPFNYQNHELEEMIAWEPSPHMMRFIFWAPNHVRAWRTSAYNTVGGHNENIKTGDDHDLCCRFYIEFGAKGIKHIDKCLYLYRVHDNNSCKVFNDDVQEQTLQNYLKYSRALAIRWAKDENLEMLDLGGRINAWEGFKTVDLMDADIITDLDKKWPFEDNSVGIIRASHIFEHLKDSVHTMNEAYRILVPGGWLFIEVPSTDGRGAFQDPTHVSFFNENSFWYYTNKDYSRYIPEYRGRFQNSRIVTYFPTEFEKTHDIPIVQADMIALKGDYANRPVGEILI